MTPEQHGCDIIIAAATSTAVDLDDQNLTHCRMCWARTGTTDSVTEGLARAAGSSLVGDPINGLTSGDTVDRASHFGVTSADVLDLSADLLVWIVIGEGVGLELTVLVFGVWPDVVDDTVFCLRRALLVPTDSELVVDGDAADARLLVVICTTITTVL